jgi:WD40 repeat protein
MFRTAILSAWLLAVVLPYPVDGFAQQAPPHVDQHGDALPPGAITRLGTLRWRHDPGPLRLAYDTKGKKLAGLSQRGNIRVWEAPSGKELCRIATTASAHFQGYVNCTYPMAFSPDGKLLAWVAKNDTIWACEADTGKGEHQLVAHEGLCCFAFSPKGDRLASSGRDGVIRLWDVATRKEVSRLATAKPDAAVWSLAFSPDGKTLAAGCWSGTVRLWDTGSGKLLHEITVVDWIFAISAVAFAPDGKVLAASGAGGDIHLISLATGKQVRMIKGRQMRNQSGFDCLSFSPDGKLIASSRADWCGFYADEVATGKEVFRQDIAHSRHVSCLVFSPDSKTLSSSGTDQMIRHWDAKTGKAVPQLAGYTAPLDVSYLRNGKLVVRESYYTHVADPSTGKDLAIIQGRVECLSPDGKTAAVTSNNTGKTQLHDLSHSKKHLDIDLPLHKRWKGGEWLSSIALSPNNKTLAVAQVNGDGYFQPFKYRVLLLDTVTGKEIGWLQEKEGNPHALCYSADGKVLICVAANDGRRTGPGPTHVHAWDVATKKSLFSATEDGIGGMGVSDSAVALSPNGKLLACGTTIRIMVDGAVKFAVPKDTTFDVFFFDDRMVAGGILCAAFSSDGRLLAQGNGDGSIAIWELSTGKNVLAFHACDAPIISVAFAPIGFELTCGMGDTTGLVWDVVAKSLGSRPSKEPELADLKKLWEDLASADAALAFKTSCAFIAAPKVAVPFLKDHVHPINRTDPRQIADLVADLGSSQFKKRERANSELHKVGREAETAMRLALQGNPELEVHLRITKLLAKMQQQPLTLSEIRLLRAFSVLEWIGTAEAAQALTALCQRDFPWQFNVEIQAAVARMAIPRD